MLDELFQFVGFETEDIVGEGLLLPILNDALPKKLTLNKDDRSSGGVVDHIKVGDKRHAIELPEGWKPQVARRFATEWAVRDGKELDPAVLVRAEKLFQEIIRRFSLFETNTARGQ